VSTPDDPNSINALTARYLPYLKEIQKKLLILTGIVFGSGIFGFIYYQKILSTILGFFSFKGITMVLTSPYQFFDLAINTGLATGVVVAVPLFIYFILSFLKPALAPKEYRQILNMVPFAFILFVIGFGFGIYVMQFVISIFSETASSFNVGNIWDISQFFSQTIIMGVCLGLIFELPVIISVLIRLNLISKATIAKNRKVVYAAIIIMAAFLPPNDIISLSILTIAPLFLFELALLLNQ
jgi:sec-independent protein translocase protein TatC